MQKVLLEKSQAELKPLKEQLTKQGSRVNSLNASLHDKEKVVKRVTGENEELVSGIESVGLKYSYQSNIFPPTPEKGQQVTDGREGTAEETA